MSDAPIKTYVLNGNLNRSSTLSIQICDQSSNIFVGLWNICIASVCIDCKDQNGVFSSVSCNLIKDKQFNSFLNPPIATLFLKGRKIVYLDKTWFTINNQCPDVKLFFSNVQNNDTLNIDCELHVNILLQRVK
jgi:hypothetical protein